MSTQVKVTVTCGAAKAWETVDADQAVETGKQLVTFCGGGQPEYKMQDDDGNWQIVDEDDLS